MTTNKINWKRMQFKKNKVWLATDLKGKPITKNGKSLIKYQLEQDYEYWVHPKSIKPIDASSSESNLMEKSELAKASSKPDNTTPEFATVPQTSTANGKTICIYTDGASSGNPGPAGVGILLKYGKQEKELSKYIGIATNNIAELEAIRIGLLELKTTDRPVRIFTDSSYAHGVLGHSWKARKNQELIKSIKKIISKFKDFQIVKVKGHAGIEGNERADFLATSAIKKAGDT
jgi:ribonuclease HI